MVTTVAACDPWVPPIGRTELSGNITTTHDGQVLENFNLNGSIRVEHDNVTIRNFSLVSQGGPAIYNLNNEKVKAYRVLNCWVSKYTAVPDLDAMSADVMIQSIVLENEGIKVMQ